MSSALRKILAFIIISLALPLIIPSTVFAQAGYTGPKAVFESNSTGSLGVARMIGVKEKNLKDGTIISNGKDGAAPSSVPYDAQVLGIVSRDAGIILNADGVQNGVPLISNGTVYILVSSLSGPVKSGDLITTSTIPGVAVKAIKDGYVLGRALEDYDNPDPKKTGKIVAELDLHYFNAKPTFLGSLTDILKLALLPTKDSPAPIFKYIVAAIVVIGSFVLGFMTFGRTAAKGVEALGRNPSAGKIIHLGIIFNVGIVVIIILAGVTVAFLILRL